MINNYTTGKTKFVKYKIYAPDRRYEGGYHEGGIDLKTALFETKDYDKRMIINIFDSKN